MLDETWGISNRTISYNGKYSKHGYWKTEDATPEKVAFIEEESGIGK